MRYFVTAPRMMAMLMLWRFILRFRVCFSLLRHADTAALLPPQLRRYAERDDAMPLRAAYQRAAVACVA